MKEFITSDGYGHLVFEIPDPEGVTASDESIRRSEFQQATAKLIVNKEISANLQGALIVLAAFITQAHSDPSSIRPREAREARKLFARCKKDKYFSSAWRSLVELENDIFGAQKYREIFPLR